MFSDPPIGIALLGSTGSIGRQTLDVVRAFPERFKIIALAAKNSAELFASQIHEFSPEISVSTADDPAAKVYLNSHAPNTIFGEEALIAAATHPNTQILVAATSGLIGLKPTLAAIEAGKIIAIANKETLVIAGSIVMNAAEQRGADIRPIDSEHSAIWQCLRGESIQQVRKLIITASGGPFRTMPAENMRQVTAKDALKHPTWVMGPKVTIDSATLMNKGLEVIEAHWLFDVPFDKIEVVVHPQSIIHSMVQFVDGSIKMQATRPTMHLPIQEAISFPTRLDSLEKNLLQNLSWPDVARLDFEAIDTAKFPCFRLAVEAGKRGGTYPAVLVGADETAVRLFLEGAIAFSDIPELIDQTLQEHSPLFGAAATLDAVLDAFNWGLIRCEQLAQNRMR